MIVKIGDKYYFPKDEPIMVVFSDEDVENIVKHSSNPKWNNKYVNSWPGQFKSILEKLTWMDSVKTGEDSEDN